MNVSIVDAYHDVVEGGVHLSTALEGLARSITSATMMATVRSRLYQAVRYRDVSGATAGKYDGVVDGALFVDRSVPSFLRPALEPLADVLASDAPVYVRANTLRCTSHQCRTALAPWHPVHIEHECLRVDAPYGLFRSEAFRSGWFEQQDLNSQRVTRMLAPQPSQRVVDACAGAGGKALHIGALMRNAGRIIALDVHAAKLDDLRTRAARAGVDIVECRIVTSTKVVKRIADSADAVLIDVPCSGTGVLRRNPDILCRLTETSLAELVTLQYGILVRNAAIARPGGRIVYATCSILPQEGRQQIERFVAEHPAYHVESMTDLPVGEGDGFFVCMLRKSGAA